MMPQKSKIFRSRKLYESFLGKEEIIDAKSIGELIKKVSQAKAKNKKAIVLGNSDMINRAALENKQVDILLNPERTRRYDYTHYRNSGLNQVLCKIAAKNNTIIGIDLNDLKKIKGKEGALRLGRIMQNIRLCAKYKVKVLLAPFTSPLKKEINDSDFSALARTIGMTTSQAKESLLMLKK